MYTSTLYQEYKRERGGITFIISTMQASGLFHRLTCSQLLLLTVILRVRGHDSLGTWQVTFPKQKVFLTTKLGWRHENEATHHKPAGLV